MLLKMEVFVIGFRRINIGMQVMTDFAQSSKKRGETILFKRKKLEKKQIKL